MLTAEKKTKRIFLADDDADDCMMFKNALHELQVDIFLEIANDGVELLNNLDESVPPPPYVIFLDLNMPRKNGFEALKEIRENAKLKDIPVVIFSTSSNPEIVERSFRLGANYYVCKPNSFALLMKMINKILTLDQQQLHHQPTRNHFVLVA